MMWSWLVVASSNQSLCIVPCSRLDVVVACSPIGGCSARVEPMPPSRACCVDAVAQLLRGVAEHIEYTLHGRCDARGPMCFLRLERKKVLASISPVVPPGASRTCTAPLLYGRCDTDCVVYDLHIACHRSHQPPVRLGNGIKYAAINTQSIPVTRFRCPAHTNAITPPAQRYCPAPTGCTCCSLPPPEHQSLHTHHMDAPS